MNIESHLSEISSALHIDKNGRLKWMGEDQPYFTPEVWSAFSTIEQQQHLGRQLKDLLYSSYYQLGHAQPTNTQNERIGNGSMETELMQCLGDLGNWDEGWKLLEKRKQASKICKNGLTLWASTEHIRNTDKGIAVLMPASRTNVSPGFFAVVGEAGPEEEQGIITRVYFHIEPAGACILTKTLVEFFNAHKTRFSYKVLSDSAAFTRADSAVLYLDKQDYPMVETFIHEHWQTLSPFLRHNTPAFTKAIAKGVAVAEDPGNGDSFGEHRCQLIAEVLIANHYSEVHEIALISSVEEAFLRNEIADESLHLRQSSEDIYRSLGIEDQPTGKLASKEETANEPLKLATEIGRFICERAHWHNDECNWITKSLDGSDQHLARAMDSVLYDGSAGITWFLAELYQETRDKQIRDTALAAARRSLHHGERYKLGNDFSFYQGWVGIVATALFTAIACEDNELYTLSIESAQQLDEGLLKNPETDLLAGLAGTLCGLSMMHRMAPELSRLPDLIEQTADEIAKRARRSAGKASWRDGKSEYFHDLCGMSHGTSGIIVALIEAGELLNTKRYEPLIREAIAYEEAWYSELGERWPDLRYYPEGKSFDHIIEAVIWCHGAPGISMSRHWAAQKLKDQSFAGMAARDGRATRSNVLEALEYENDQLFLCHGLAGNTLSLMSIGLADQPMLDRVIQQSEAYMKRQQQPSADIPLLECFNGIAGLGHFLLCSNSGKASPLLLPASELLPGFVCSTLNRKESLLSCV